MSRWQLAMVMAGGLLMGSVATPVWAQEKEQQPQPPQGQAERGGGGRGGNFDPARMQQRRMEMIKDALNVNDQEWAALSPKVEKVMTATRDARFGGMMGMMGRGGRGGRGGDAPPMGEQSVVGKAMADLRAALDDANATPEMISQKLTALRDARHKSQEELAAAQKDLKEVLTQRQEAVLVTQGLLE